MLSGYASIYNLGHSAIADLLNGDVIVEEKVDGSQFSFGLHYESGELMCRSKGASLHPEAPEPMFDMAVATAKELAPILKKGWTYRCEYLRSPKHNALVYERVPVKHLIIFDINPGLESYLSPSEKEDEADRLGLEVVPQLFYGRLTEIDKFRSFLDTVSVLGGQKIEGVVIKPARYDLFGKDKKCLMGKFVSEAFKEVHSSSWKEANPTPNDVLACLGAKYTTQARWMKAVQHLRDAGKLECSPRDIGALLKEVPTDIAKECAEEIKEQLFKWAWPKIRRSVTHGLPEWYKEELVKLQFANTKGDTDGIPTDKTAGDAEAADPHQPINV